MKTIKKQSNYIRVNLVVDQRNTNSKHDLIQLVFALTTFVHILSQNNHRPKQVNDKLYLTELLVNVALFVLQ